MTEQALRADNPCGQRGAQAPFAATPALGKPASFGSHVRRREETMARMIIATAHVSASAMFRKRFARLFHATDSGGRRVRPADDRSGRPAKKTWQNPNGI